ncbi:T9SS type A sorting domain-containing protein [Candidatus Cloacimonadota bacterium]
MRGFLIIFLFTLTVGLSGQNLLNQPESIVYDQINDRYLVSNYGDGSIVAMTIGGEQSYFSTELTRIAGLYIYGDTLLVASNLAPYVSLIGFNLHTDEMVINIPIPESSLLNDITSDAEGYVYITDFWNTKIFKVDIPAQNYWIYMIEGLSDPNGIIYDEDNNRLVVTSTAEGYPLHEVNLEDSTVSVITYTNIPSQDGLARDPNGNYYLSSWYYNACFRFDAGFSGPAEQVSSGHAGPADIFFDEQYNFLWIPNFNSNSVEFVPIDINAAEEAEIPEPVFDISNYPNPFNPCTTISFSSNTEITEVTELYICNIKGQKVRTIPVSFNSAQDDSRKSYSVTWNGTDNNGNEVPAGIYFYTLNTDKHSKTKKMILLK